MGKDVEKKDLPEEESKTTVAEVKENAVAEAKKFSEKDFGKFKGKHIIMAVCAVVVLCVLVSILKGLFGSKAVEYPVVYNNSDGDLYLMTTKVKKEDKAVKLSNGDSVYSVRYANTTNRYLLFEKDGDLMLYDSKKKDQTNKIVKDVDEYTFTENDKYVIATDEDDSLYAFNYGKEKYELDKEIDDVYGLTNDRILYVKEGDLYVRGLGKKDDKVKVADSGEFSSASLSKDGKNVVFIDEDGNLQLYSVSKKKNTKVASDVYYYNCDTKSCTNMYYRDDDGVIYYYNGKEGKKVAEDVTPYAYDVDKQLIVYAEDDDDEVSLYFKKGTADAAKIEEDIDGIKSVRIYNGKSIYYVTDDGEVKFAKISGNKVKEPVKLAEDAAGTLYEYKNGYVFVADINKEGSEGDLYFANGGSKAKKVDSDVSSSLIRISNNGSKVYYMKDYSKSSGSLYVSSGGKGKKISDDVYVFQYIKDDLIYFIKDYSSSKGKGDLYRYTGSKNPTKIAEDVTRLASTPNSFSKTKK